MGMPKLIFLLNDQYVLSDKMKLTFEKTELVWPYSFFYFYKFTFNLNFTWI